MKDLRDTPVKKVMRRKIQSVSPDTPIKKLIKKFESYGIQYLPVLDKKGKFLGSVRQEDVIKLALDPTEMTEHDLVGIFGTKITWDLMPETVRDIIVPHEILLKPDDPVKYAAKLMVDNDLKVLPVMRKGKIVGIIDEETLIRRVIERL